MNQYKVDGSGKVTHKWDEATGTYVELKPD
jgi:hypothetical protein